MFVHDCWGGEPQGGHSASAPVCQLSEAGLGHPCPKTRDAGAEGGPGAGGHKHRIQTHRYGQTGNLHYCLLFPPRAGYDVGHLSNPFAITRHRDVNHVLGVTVVVAPVLNAREKRRNVLLHRHKRVDHLLDLAMLHTPHGA